MSASPEQLQQSVKYHRTDQPATFRRSRAQWGELSNMTGGFPIHANGILFQSSDSLYQALKFPHSPRRQQAIAAAHSGYAAKVVAYEPGEKPYAQWDCHRVDAMRVALAFKLFQNPRFGDALLATGSRAIVESSDRDVFWGARPTRDGYASANVLGRVVKLFWPTAPGPVSGRLPGMTPRFWHTASPHPAIL